MGIDQYKPGDAVVIKAHFQKASPDPWGTDANANPDNGAKITIANPSGTAVITAQAMTASSQTGKYYYIWQSSTSSPKGKYKATVTADGTTYDSLEDIRFELI